MNLAFLQNTVMAKSACAMHLNGVAYPSLRIQLAVTDLGFLCTRSTFDLPAVFPIHAKPEPYVIGHSVSIHHATVTPPYNAYTSSSVETANRKRVGTMESP